MELFPSSLGPLDGSWSTLQALRKDFDKLRLRTMNLGGGIPLGLPEYVEALQAALEAFKGIHPSLSEESPVAPVEASEKPSKARKAPKAD